MSTNTLHLWFQGYTQFRMATDPDPSDDPRGLSGYTFALPGEPDFDQTLRFQPDEPGVWQRNFGTDTFAPRVGVTVKRAELSGVPATQYVGACVSLLEARLVELNGLVVRNDYFALDPVRLRVALNGNTLLERVDLLDPARPHLSILEAGTPELLRRQPTTWVSNSEEVAHATGLPQPVTDQALVENRQRRQRCLETLLTETVDPVERSALETRIEELRILHKWWDLSEYGPGGPPLDRRAYTLALQAKGWDVGINGPVLVNQIGASDTAPWPLRFWLGGWDADALCAYINGEVEIPLAAG